MAALYSREFYELARTRLQPGGYISQWLPTYQVRTSTAEAMVAAFVDVFPQSVLLSGAGSDLILLGINGPRIEIDPARLQAALAAAPAVRTDLERVDLGALHEIVGTFVGSARRLAEATREVPPIVDDHPMQEYDVRSMLNYGHGVPDSIVGLDEVGAWCPRCFMAGRPVPAMERLDAYLELLKLAYAASSNEMAATRQLWETEGRTVAGSRYLGAIVPESAELHNVLGLGLAERARSTLRLSSFAGRLRSSQTMRQRTGTSAPRWRHRAEHPDAITHLARAVELDPANSRAHGDLGLILAIQGRLDEAAGHLEVAITLDPQAEDARKNLAVVQQRRARGTAQR